MVNKIEKVLNIVLIIVGIIFLFTVLFLKMDLDIQNSEIREEQLKSNIIFSEDSEDFKYGIILVAEETNIISTLLNNNKSETITAYVTDFSNKVTFEYFTIELNDNFRDCTFNLSWNFDETVLTISSKEMDVQRYSIILDPYSDFDENQNIIKNMYYVFY